MAIKPTIGFIGLGIMGKPMCRNLLQAGYPVVVYTRTKSKIEEMVKEGGTRSRNSQGGRREKRGSDYHASRFSPGRRGNSGRKRSYRGNREREK